MKNKNNNNNYVPYNTINSNITKEAIEQYIIEPNTVRNNTISGPTLRNKTIADKLQSGDELSNNLELNFLNQTMHGFDDSIRYFKLGRDNKEISKLRYIGKSNENGLRMYQYRKSTDDETIFYRVRVKNQNSDDDLLYMTLNNLQNKYQKT